MFQKSKLRKQIKKCKEKIAEVESLRYRSQAALVEAILVNKEPDDQDVDYFNKYTEEIDRIREEIHKLQRELDQLS